MPDPPTPGETAYTAYYHTWLRLHPRSIISTWAELMTNNRYAWEVAAQAVRRVEPAGRALLYVVVLQEGAQIQLCGAYPNADEAGIHLVHARTLMPDRLFAVRVCPFALTGGVHRQEAPNV